MTKRPVLYSEASEVALADADLALASDDADITELTAHRAEWVRECDEAAARVGYLMSQIRALDAAINRTVQRDPARWLANPPPGYRVIVRAEPIGEGD